MLLVAGAGVGAWWFGWERYTSAPGVLGMAQKQAEKKLDAAGLEVEVGDPAYSETVPAGRVLGADPSAGSRVLDGGTVTLVISLGKERYDVPVTEGLTEDAAQDALQAATWPSARRSAAGRRPSTRAPCCAATRRSARRLRPGTVVDLFVSKGRKPLTVTDWTGKDFDDAETALERKGFEVASTDAYSDTVPEGDVISQSPTDGTLFRGEDVTIVVSLGPELVEVPGGLVASGWEAAQQTLEDAGFAVDDPAHRQLPRARVRLQRRPRVRERDPEGVHGHPLADLTWRRRRRGVRRCSPPWRCWRSRPAGAARSS